MPGFTDGCFSGKCKVIQPRSARGRALGVDFYAVTGIVIFSRAVKPTLAFRRTLLTSNGRIIGFPGDLQANIVAHGRRASQMLLSPSGSVMYRRCTVVESRIFALHI